MEIRKVSDKEKKYINRIVDIHLATFEGFFLTFMGRGFLKQMYMAYTKHTASDIFIALDNGEVVGFLAYSEHMSGLYKHMIKHCLIQFAWYSLGAFIRKPKVFMRLIRAFLKPNESKRNEKYIELASIGVHPEAKSKGIGSRLIEALKDVVDFGKFEYITLETDAVDNKIANKFYIKNGFSIEREFETREGRKMFEYRFKGASKNKKTKLLYILNIAKRVNNFSYTSMIAAQEMGLEFHIAGNWSYSSDEERTADENKYGIKIHQIDFIRKPYHPGNRRAYTQLKELAEKENYDIIHCNTPIGGVMGRLLGKKCKVPKVIYQVHGFHFYKGAPKLNWMLYYPIEKWLAHYTDALITINREDHELAKSKLKLRKGGSVYYVPGVGIDISQYNTEASSRAAKRNELGLNNGDIALISMGDLIERKNYDTAIRAVAEAKNERLHYYICGKGPEEETLKMLVQSINVSDQIHFLGFRSDIRELLTASDIFLFTTKQEGLPRSMMEAMASGLPCVASRIRGNTDLLESTEGGFLCDTTDISAYAEKINLLASDTDMREKMGKNNLFTIQKFSTGTVTDEVRSIYNAEFGGHNP